MKKTIQTIAVAALCILLSIAPRKIIAQFIPLKIGDKLPEAVWDLPLTVLNHPEGKTNIRLRDYKGKLIILDFWATWCAACIASFPKANKLQEDLPDKVSFIAVSREPAVKQQTFFESRNAKGLIYDFPSIVGDTVLQSLFPHISIPHYAWIDPDGMVSGVSTSERLTKENFQLVLERKKPPIPVKKDIDANRPIFLSDVIDLEDLSAFSLLTKGNYDGLPSGMKLRKEADIIRGRALTNLPVLSLYLAAIRPLFERNNESYNSKRLILELADPARVDLQKSAEGSYKTDNLFNYELLVPVADAARLDDYMLEDLNRYTPYLGRIETRKVKCLVLVRTGSADKIKSKGGKPENTLFFKTPSRLTNYPLSYLVTQLNSGKRFTLPIIDGTGYTGNTDLEFSSKADPQSLMEELAFYGLALKEEYRMLKMFVLYDKSKLNQLQTHN